MINFAQLPEFPFTPHFAEINSHKLAYLDEGPDGTLTPELMVTRETPPIFIFGTQDDVKYSGPSSLTITDAMRRAGAPVELHYLSKGGHGYGMRQGAGLIWPGLYEKWLFSVK